MVSNATAGLAALTEKEKDALRLLARGHDAKSTARTLGLSVHTINERLRDVRRKLATSSSREAARLLMEAEATSGEKAIPEILVDKGFREDARPPLCDEPPAPAVGVWRVDRQLHTIGGVVAMMLAIGLAAVLSSQAVEPASSTRDPIVSPQASESALIASQWLALLDKGQWNESYQATSASFRSLNTTQVWTQVSEQVRAPLGAAISRNLLSEERVPAPPAGYQVVKFQTRFAKTSAVETVTLQHENGTWKISGVSLDQPSGEPD